MFSIKDKVCIITGSYTGIGLGVVKRFVKAGAKVVMADIEDGSEIAAELGCIFIKTDVSQEEDVRNLMETTFKTFGKIDVLVNNAGILIPEQTFENTDMTAFRRVCDVNINGVVFGIKYVQAYMKDGGSIINTASVGGLYPFFSGYGAYCATKAAIISLTKTAAIELAPRNIRVNCVCPGTIDTNMAHEEGCETELQLAKLMHPLGRMGNPDECAALYHFLAADDCSFMTGTPILVDGGYMAGPNNDILGAVIESIPK